MTEKEWTACTDPTPMLEFLRGKISNRKLRLFACACCRRIWHLLPDRRSRKAVEASERFADGQITLEKLQCVRGDARWAANVATRNSDDSEGVKWIVAHLTEPDVQRVLFAVWPASYLGGREIEYPLQCALLRDIFRNRIDPVTLDPRWLAWNENTIPKLAKGIYDERAFDRLPILADALEAAGCTNPDILTHCRSDGPHAKGCWVVDMILDKQ